MSLRCECPLVVGTNPSLEPRPSAQNEISTSAVTDAGPGTGFQSFRVSLSAKRRFSRMQLHVEARNDSMFVQNGPMVHSLGGSR